ncbi:ATP-binding protein [Jeongeupia sp. USM3]|uniref:ATP-binding protein n=1 Tax=Jeongeupia sp. USM3 TaxID=1906741 RepID=UPI0009F3F7A3|nr:HAMP domain-containing sensor histidine kinase [Jeongeupia sp. USM3]
MAFEFKARVLLELGEELISSDAIALYELVKNSLDAESPSVLIDICIGMQYSAYMQLKGLVESYESMGAEAEFDIDEFNESISAYWDSKATDWSKERFEKHYGKPKTLYEIRENLEVAYLQSSRIAIIDTGSGMSLKLLSGDYLTVGTPTRLEQKKKLIKATVGNSSRLQYTHTNTKIPLGEKGIGRLSAMRLGHYITLKTKQTHDKEWHRLRMDWRPAAQDPTLNANDPILDFKPFSYPCEVDEVSRSGTEIFIRDLKGDWSLEKIQRIAKEDLAKIADPFQSLTANKFIKVRYQGNPVTVPILDREPLKYCDAIVDAKLRYTNNNEPELTISVNYLEHHREKTVTIKSDHLRSCVREEVSAKKKNGQKPLLVDAEIVAHALNHLGPWEMKFYWFNRGRIRKRDSELYTNLIEVFLNQWGGGLLVYRDGYRVYPYGERSDDWLALDKKALASGAFKLNRAQIAGYLRLSSIANPLLQDQTNREGFRDTLDKEALRRLLRYVIIGYCRPFLEEVERECDSPIEQVAEDVEKRISTSKEVAVATLQKISESTPSESQNVAKVMHHLEEVSEAWERAKLRIRNFEKDMEGYIHLAGVGLMLEFIAHELSRITQDTLKAVAAGNLSPDVVQAQLKTLEKRVRILDELSIPGRQIRQLENIKDVVMILAEFHQTKAERHEISLHVNEVSSGKSEWREKIEKGQLLQILDNLLSNSFYWLSNRFDKSKQGEISIQLDRIEREIRLSDNGPGISEDRADEIFDQFVTSKPPRDGRGLGLFIARKLAEENNATLQLIGPDADGMYRTFSISFAEA